MLYHLLVADDDLIECDAVALILEKLPQTASVTTCEDGHEAMEILQKQKIDVVFSDINMPGMDGLTVLKNLPDPPPFVFITSYADYAVDSFNLDAIDFVLKPITHDRVMKAAGKAFDYIAMKAALKDKSLTGQYEMIETANLADDHFFIRETKGITRIRYADVTHIESMRDFSRINKLDGEMHIILSSLKNLEGQLPDNLFKRVHRQYIVNINHVLTVSNKEIFLKNGTGIPLSLVYREDITNAFMGKGPIKRS